MRAAREWMQARWGRLACLAVTALGATGCDQHSKSWAVGALSDLPGQSLAVAEPWMRFSLAFNRGTAFSVVRDAGAASWLLAGLAVFIVGLTGLWLWREGGWVRCIGAGLVAGGALGNAYDRVMREGVVDFISVTLPGGYRWPTFNIADAALLVGAGLLLLASWRARPRPREDDPVPTVTVSAA